MRKQDEFLRDHFEFDHEHGNLSRPKVDDEPLFYRRYWKVTVYIPKDVYDENDDIDDMLNTMNESLGKISEHIEMYEGVEAVVQTSVEMETNGTRRKQNDDE